MRYFIKSFLVAALLIFSFLFPGMNVSSGTGEKHKCLPCHDSIYHKGLNRTHIHPPFLDKKCSICHLDEVPSAIESHRRSSRPGTHPKIRWLQRHYEASTTHFFLIASATVDDNLFIKQVDNSGRSKLSSIDLPPLQQLSQLSNDNQAPKLFDIQFHGVKQGILDSATISWKTDEPSDATIEYGVEEITQNLRFAPQFKSKHVIDISPIISGKIYQYRVLSKDIHGNQRISQPLTFSTRKGAQSHHSRGEESPDQQFSRKGLSHQLVAVGNQYFLTLRTNRPVQIYIGSHRKLRPRADLPAKTGEAPLPFKHMVMKTTYDTNITSCISCHKGYNEKSNHPINVLPPRGMVFPNDYPLLENGRIHCMTCHDMHASDNVARLRRKNKQDLCIGCHKNYG